VFGSTINPTDLLSEGIINDAVFTDATATVLGSFVFSGVGKRRNSIARLLLGNTALPVTLTSFTATRQQQIVHLQWTTASEQNNRGFTIQRSRNAQTFTSIGFVAAAGDGNSNATRQYQFKDERPLNGINYYRLQQKDVDGGYSYSATRTVNFNLSSYFKVYPAITQNQINIELANGLVADGSTILRLVDVSGKIHVSKPMRLSKETMYLQGLPTGMYLLQIQHQGKIYHQKIIKE